MRALPVSFACFGLVALALAACGGNAPQAPTADPGLLPDVQHKVVVTIDTANFFETLTPTVAASATLPNVPTSTPPPTQTPTPYVGTFIGQPTSEDADGRFILPPTIPPFSIQPGAGSGAIPEPGGDPGSNIVSGPNPTLPVSGEGNTCATPVAAEFTGAYNANPSFQTLGCPLDTGSALTLVTQPFERGRMIWRDNLQIIALANTSSFWRMADTWNEGLPDSDPSLAPPEGLLQPVRGFGYAWRNTQAVKDTLGWALEPEALTGAFWQEFDGGSLLLINGVIYAVPRANTGTYYSGTAQ